MRLLREYVRMVLNETSGYFGEKFVEFKSRVAAGEDPIYVADDILIPIGRGSTRAVFGIPGNNDQVVKMINTRIPMQDSDVDIHGFSRKQKIDSNKWESDLKLQQRYPNIFPRTFEVADDHSWILAERVEPIDKQKFFELLGLAGEVREINRDQWLFLVELIKEHYKHEFDPDHYSHQYVLSEGEDDYSTSTVDSDYFELPTMPIGQLADIEPLVSRPPGYETLNRRITSILSNPQNRSIFKAMADLDIPSEEFTPKNTGVSEIGGEHLVILDASLWSDYTG
jgi:hypothetical protein